MEFCGSLVTLGIDADARVSALVDRGTGRDWAIPGPVASLRTGGRMLPATEAAQSGTDLDLRFAGCGARARLRIAARGRLLAVEVVELAGDGVEELAFLDVRLKPGTDRSPEFAACLLARTLLTNVAELPGPSDRLRATCSARFGFAGAGVALVAGPHGSLPDLLREAVSDAPDLPRSPLGGPWAAGAPLNRGSYLFNFDGITEATVGDWIALAQAIGFTQIDFHGGTSHRFGDCRPDPVRYPAGRASLAAVVDRLHGAGIAAGLHTYAFFMAKDCPWVSPVPDPRLGSDAVFTLAGAVDATGAEVRVVEPTAGMSTVTGFFVRNSVTLRIENELVTYTGVSAAAPFGFTGCTRGALGTAAASHPEGAKVHHLKECFALFAPDGDSDLLSEIAACTARTFNECGFDMLYLDALDGEDILGGPEHGWHYGSKFVFELWKRLSRPALVEMSTFHHHLWTVRSRIGAWDHPTRGIRRYIDTHCDANDRTAPRLLPGHLGWWAILPWKGPQEEPTRVDDLEYLCAKAIGTGCGISLMGIDPAAMAASPVARRLAGTLRAWEEVRRAGSASDRARARLSERGREFTLRLGRDGGPRFHPVARCRHRWEGRDERTRSWEFRNPFAAQAVRARIELLTSLAPFADPGSLVVVEPGCPETLPQRASARGVQAELLPSPLESGGGGRSGLFSAQNLSAVAEAAWTMAGRRFSPALDLAAAGAGTAASVFLPDRRGFGVWVHGDGAGELLNLQLRSPLAVTGAVEDHYIDVDFQGWRYFELLEPEGERVLDYRWPYELPEWPGAAPEALPYEPQESGLVPPGTNSAYHVYRETTDHRRIETVRLWLTGVRPEQQVACILGPVRALPLVSARMADPVLVVNGERLVFPVEMETGDCLELESAGECRLFARDGSLRARVRVPRALPMLRRGSNSLGFEGTPQIEGIAPRARITVAARGPSFS